MDDPLPRRPLPTRPTRLAPAVPTGTTTVVRQSASNWFVRVDGPRSFLEDKCKLMFQWIDVTHILAVYHEGGRKENPHCHILVKLKTVLQKQSFDVRIKKTFEIVKRSDYSTKVWDGNPGHGAGSYLFHEESAVIIYNKHFTEEEIKAFQDANEIVQKVVKVNNERASNKLIDKALIQFQDWSWNADKIEKDIFMYMMKCIHLNENYHPGDFMLKRYVQEVCIRLCPADDFENYASRQYWKLFPN